MDSLNPIEQRKRDIVAQLHSLNDLLKSFHEQIKKAEEQMEKLKSELDRLNEGQPNGCTPKMRSLF